MNDSWQYPESILYQGWTDTISYAPMERAISGLLYDSRLRPGMTKDQVNDALSIQ